MDDIVIQTGPSAASSAEVSPIAGRSQAASESVGSSTLPNSQTIYDIEERYFFFWFNFIVHLLPNFPF